MDNSTLTRLGLAVLGQALPKASALEQHGKNAKSAITCTIISAMLFTSIIVFALYMIHTLLVNEGMSEVVSLLVPAVFGLLIAVIVGQRADKQISKIADAKSSLSLFASRDNSASSLVEDLASSFLEGVNSAPLEKEQQETLLDEDSITLIKT